MTNHQHHHAKTWRTSSQASCGQQREVCWLEGTINNDHHHERERERERESIESTQQLVSSRYVIENDRLGSFHTHTLQWRHRFPTRMIIYANFCSVDCDRAKRRAREVREKLIIEHLCGVSEILTNWEFSSQEWQVGEREREKDANSGIHTTHINLSWICQDTYLGWWQTSFFVPSSSSPPHLDHASGEQLLFLNDALAFSRSCLDITRTIWTHTHTQALRGWKMHKGGQQGLESINSQNIINISIVSRSAGDLRFSFFFLMEKQQ